MKGLNSLKVEVDNSYDETIPPLEADFTFYGGIYRKVFLVKENPVHFAKELGTDAVKIEALLDGDSKGKLQLSGKIINKKDREYTLKILVSGTGIEKTLKKVSDVFSTEISMDEPNLWSPDAPHLYTVKVELYLRRKLLDVYESKIGFRRFSATTTGFKLNNKPVKLIGVNRHQDWEGMGNAVPVEKQLEDLVAIKAMGANFLRLAHYPQDAAIYKAADSLGIILWSEIPVVNKVPVSDAYEEFKTNSLHMQKEHIAQNYNHPSLVFVGYMNEIFLRMVFDKPDETSQRATIDNTLDLAKALEALTRKEAPHHLTVMALHGNKIYNETGIADLPMVIGWNLYYGWYGGEMNELGDFLDDQYVYYPNRPLIISEYGVGADMRLHSDHSRRFDFSEEYQFKYHPSYYKQVMERDFVIGMAAWNYADFGSEFRGDAIPHVNQKGLVNFDRSPKNIYYWYKMTLNPEVKSGRFFEGFHTYIADDDKKEIIIISNQNVILKDNYGYRSDLKPFNDLISYYADLAPGQNTFELYDDKGNFLDSLGIFYSKPDLAKIDDLAVNFGTDTYFKDSLNRIWVPLKSVLSALQVTGDNQVISSSTNIKGTVDDPLYQTALSRLDEIRVHVPKATYLVTLSVAEYANDSRLAYELNKENNRGEASSALILKINDQEIFLDKIPAFTKKDIPVKVGAVDGITIRAADGKKFKICGLAIKKIKPAHN
ncbi:MAG: glycoside hydrolase family 2, partial [Flavobacteriaceae bacterium]|nr:glycoside hydrolase family 2 [Flavobacteriaceae bacterium]